LDAWQAKADKPKNKGEGATGLQSECTGSPHCVQGVATHGKTADTPFQGMASTVSARRTWSQL
jgi:hypothetical protein